MRAFFKSELETLHLKTGYQQYYKLSEMHDGPEQIKTLLDLLVNECNKFPLIPDADKKQIILRFMIEDADFQGFNPKILWKWFNIVNKNYIVGQSDFVENEKDFVPMDPEKWDAMLNQWKVDIAKIGNPQVARPDGINDQRIQQMKDAFRGIECKHTGIRIDVSDTEEVCNDCGKTLMKGKQTNKTL